jgi:hypothetical protein
MLGGVGGSVTGNGVVGEAGPGLDDGVDVGKGSVGEKEVGERLVEGRRSSIVKAMDNGKVLAGE